MIYDMIYLTAGGLTPGGSSTVHIYPQTVHRTTQSTQTMHRTTQLTNWEECRPCPVFASYTVAFALQLREKRGKTSVRVIGVCHLALEMTNWLGKSQRVILRAQTTACQVFLQLATSKNSGVRGW